MQVRGYGDYWKRGSSELNFNAGLCNMILTKHAPIVQPPVKLTPPRIGAEWPEQGGVYAGVMRGRDGAADYHLIVCAQSGGELKWSAAVVWAGSQVNLLGAPKYDWSLPYRAELALLGATVPEMFKKTYCWSCEQHAEDADYAWAQDFGYGGQHGYHKDNEWLAHAVRRVVI